MPRQAGVTPLVVVKYFSPTGSFEREMSVQVSSSSSDHDSKLRCPSQNCSIVASKRDVRPRWPRGKVSALGPEGSKPDSIEDPPCMGPVAL
ncbi:hypothetical protein AVEN_47224-1 [Araneus ventricosus]|uniref:Uncharacterized protein n=1 Tax=Araneus ventricosus TaxID=182803 RepID=A0A4Y2HG26_ARAVE|nr:hypothetical protein AVEN_47224-1 [Araneus ventricosus]